MHIRNIFIVIVIVSMQYISAQQSPLLAVDKVQQKWVDSLYNTFTLQEKIGQLFMVAARSDKNHTDTKKAILYIKKYYVGSVIFFKGKPLAQVKMTNELQEMSRTPLMIGVDGEWGLSMRLDDTFAYPWNMTLGAINNNSLIKRTGKQIAAHCKAMGIHINFAPVVDINSNPKNPIIGNRSFGENKFNVTDKSIAMMLGMQSGRILTTAKHFPGHGNTAVDSHKALPILNFSKSELQDIEMYPYRPLIYNGVSGIMVGHLQVPALDEDNHPASLSKNIITGILKNQMNYQGLILTDALNMKGADEYKKLGDASVAAFLAGADMLMMPRDLPTSFQAMLEAFHLGKLSSKRLEYSVKKILQAKYKVGLYGNTPIQTSGLSEKLHTVRDDVLLEELVENAITVIKNKEQILPITGLEKHRIAYLPIGDSDHQEFYKTLNLYAKVDKLTYTENTRKLLSSVAPYDLVIVGFHKSSTNPWKPYAFTSKQLKILKELVVKKSVILDVFTKPYALIGQEETMNDLEGIVVSYQNNKIFQNRSAQLIFGAIAAKGHLPVTITSEYPVGTGIEIPRIPRLGYMHPERANMDMNQLQRIDDVADYMIAQKMTPGAQILIARGGKIIFNKSYGTHTYDSKKKVKDTDVYDLASLTKILATLPEILKLDDEGYFNIEKQLKDYLPETELSNKGDLYLMEMLSHNAGLIPWIPFYKRTLLPDSHQVSKEYYKTQQNKNYDIKVAKDLYLKKNYLDDMYCNLLDSRLLKKHSYKYSDLTFYFLQKIIEKYYGKGLDYLLQKHYYESIGATRLTYNPLKHISERAIIPSEKDNYYRHQELKGYVHDMGAAMLGGVGGHAGLFGNANDVAKMMQLYLQKGVYGEYRYFSSEVFDRYNHQYFAEHRNRRALILDKKPFSGQPPSSCFCTSEESFGHSGFTGTFAWADPKYQLVYVFLSNRTYPTMKNNKLSKQDIRTHIQQIIYESIKLEEQ